MKLSRYLITFWIASAALVEALPLNFRFSPKFDYNSKKSPTPRKHLKAYPATRHIETRELPGRIEKTDHHRRYIRDTSGHLDAKITALKVHLAELKSKLNIHHDSGSNVLFDEVT